MQKIKKKTYMTYKVMFGFDADNQKYIEEYGSIK